MKLPWWSKQLTAPLAFVLIEQGESKTLWQVLFKSKKFYDFTAPVVLATLSTIGVYFVKDINLLGQDGVFRHFLALIQVLVAFYIASLAAVASLSNDWMNEPLRGEKAKLKGKELNRKAYILKMFGYLAYMSIVFYLFLVGLIAVVPAFSVNSEKVYLAYKMFGTFGVFCMFYNIVIVTLNGIYFLSDRILPEDSNT